MLYKDHAVLVLHEGDKVLFVQRSKNKKTLPNIWAFPSGTVEAGEKIEETAVREAQEELGVDIKVEKTIATLELPEFSVRLHFLVCAVVSGQLEIKEPDEIQTLRWLTFSQFFEEYSDEKIGHGLIWFRQHPEVWQPRIKVYVGCSLTYATQEHRDAVEAIKALLERDPNLEVLKFLGLNKGNDRDVYNWDIKGCVGSADIILAICDHPSTGLGYELATAIEKRGIPVLAVAHEKSLVTRVVIGIDHPKFTFRLYQDLMADVPKMLQEKIKGNFLLF